ncbi:MAG: class I SAM-dependent methyltransferase [Gaiellaceae bacterium]
MYDRLVERLVPRAGETWLDVATGTGEIAVRAARGGATVTGLDLSPGMIEKARLRPEPVEWLVGDCQNLPFADGAFDVVASNFGAIFAPEASKTASELTRVCRGRIGITAWEPHPEQELWQRLLPDEDAGPSPWSDEASVRALLAGFELDIEHRTWTLDGASSAALWDWMSRAFPPHHERVLRMTASQIEEARTAFERFHEDYRVGERIRYPRDYMLVVGTKR